MRQFKNMFDGRFSIKKEVIIVNDNDEIVTRKNKNIFTQLNPYIKENLSKSKIELVTPVCNSIDMSINLLKDIQSVAIMNIQKKYFSKQSSSPKNNFKKMAKVNFRVSFSEDYLHEMYKENKSDNSFDDFSNELYFKVFKYLMKDIYFFKYLTSVNPPEDKCLLGDNFPEKQEPIELKRDGLDNINSISLNFIDVNPFTESGVSKTDLKYIHLYMLYSLHQKDFEFSLEDWTLENKNREMYNLDNNLIENLKAEIKI